MNMDCTMEDFEGIMWKHAFGDIFGTQAGKEKAEDEKPVFSVTSCEDTTRVTQGSPQ